jgi:hypothetical protein
MTNLQAVRGGPYSCHSHNEELGTEQSICNIFRNGTNELLQFIEVLLWQGIFEGTTEIFNGVTSGRCLGDVQ